MVRSWRRIGFPKENTEKKETKDKIPLDDGTLISMDLSKNLTRIKQAVGNSPDVTIREYYLGHLSVQVAVVYAESLVNKDEVSNFIKQSLNIDQIQTSISEQSVFQFIKGNALTVQEIKVIDDWDAVILSILSGDTVLLINGCTQAISGSTTGGEQRSIVEPTTQTVVRGPKDSFSESIATNISLIRRRITSSDLWLETMKIGQETKTTVGIMYMKGIVNDNLIQEVKQRLNKINIDMIIDSGQIEEFIQDQTFTPSPTVYNTERPDSVVANLMEGRVAILVNGSPFVLIVPTLFVQFFQTPEDYYHKYDIAIFLRLLRYISFLISLVAPSVYIAAITFHQEMIPTPLLISLAASREGVPFPTFIEALLMEATFELLREAGIRMPRAVGQAVSIVGALVLGQAAVQAGIVSPQMVIIVAITGIASFSTPAYDLAISVRLIRFVLMMLAASFGFYGISLGFIMLIAHLNSLRSFGVPYLAPLSPFIPSDQKDALIRVPLWSMLGRPRLINQKNIVRKSDDLSSPSHPNGEETKKGE